MNYVLLQTKELAVNDEGTFTAVFAVGGVPDMVGDVVEVGGLEFIDSELPILANHNGLPIGIGTPRVEGDLACIDGKFFLNTSAGREAYETVKALGSKAKWSFGFVINEHKFERDVRIIRKATVFEVSLVGVPAQPLTGTLAVKSVVPFHSEGITHEGRWQRPNLSDFTDMRFDELSASERRRIGRHYAWSAAWPPESFDDLKLPHHVPRREGVGEAHWRGVVAAMAALLGARGGVDIPDADREGVYQHLARHYEEFDVQPPELSERGLATVRKQLEAIEHMDAVAEVIRREVVRARKHSNRTH
jgi:HK97 family phage prohead protease